MDFSQIVNTENLNPKALQYAEAILDGMPPKQAKIQRLAITKLCQLLFTEGQIAGTLQQVEMLSGLIKNPLSEVTLIAGLLERLKQNECELNPVYDFQVRPEISALPLSIEGAKLCELAFRYFEHAAGNKGTTQQA